MLGVTAGGQQAPGVTACWVCQLVGSKSLMAGHRLTALPLQARCKQLAGMAAVCSTAATDRQVHQGHDCKDGVHDALLRWLLGSHVGTHGALLAPCLDCLHGEPFSAVNQARLAAWCRHESGGHGVVKLQGSG